MEKIDIIEIFKETFNDDCLRYTQTPFRWKGKDFIGTLREKFTGYQLIVSRFFVVLNALKKYNDYLKYKSKISTICSQLVICIEEYFKGLPYKAYMQFDKIINDNFDEQIAFMVYFSPWLGNTKFYRTVTISDGRSYKRDRCFHVPYNMREKVSTSRFSIPGHPSLYLSDNIDLCNIEIGKEKDKLFSKFQVNYETKLGPNFRIVDLSMQVNDVVDMLGEGCDEDTALKFIIGYLMRLPIQLACSFIRIDRNSSFSVEYVIPQIVMQWVKENISSQAVVGIKYKSCANKLCSQLGNNYVFPTSGLSENQNDFCPVLSNSFIMTLPVNSNDYNTLDEIKTVLDQMELKKVK